MRQRHRDREIGDRQMVAEQEIAAGEMVVEHCAELLQESGRFLDRLVIDRAETEFRLDHIIEIERCRRGG